MKSFWYYESLGSNRRRFNIQIQRKLIMNPAEVRKWQITLSGLFIIVIFLLAKWEFKVIYSNFEL